MKSMLYKNSYITVSLVSLCLLILSSCKEDDPKKEDVPELITKVVLTFDSDGGEPIVATATDPDGNGVQPVKTDGDISLNPNTSYTLSIQLLNTLAEPTDDAYNVTAEVEEEGDEHMFFFGWTNNLFSSPSGNGNVDTRADAVSYEGAANATDGNGLPLGLTTTWTTSTNVAGNFNIILKHQPDLKSDTSDATIGETDLDVTFKIVVGD